MSRLCYALLREPAGSHLHSACVNGLVYGCVRTPHFHLQPQNMVTVQIKFLLGSALLLHADRVPELIAEYPQYLSHCTESCCFCISGRRQLLASDLSITLIGTSILRCDLALGTS